MSFFGKKPTPPPAYPATPVQPQPVALTPPAPAPVAPVVPAVAAPVLTVRPPGIAPATRQLQQKTRRLSRELQTAKRALLRSRVAPKRSLPVAEAPAPAPAVVAPVIAPVSVAAVVEAPPPTPAPAPAAPALDAAAIALLVAKSPVFVEMQYEVLDLRHAIDALKRELAELKASAAADTGGVLKTTHLVILDEAGRAVAGITSDGVVSCSSISLRTTP